jgi:hypothetical protein
MNDESRCDTLLTAGLEFEEAISALPELYQRLEALRYRSSASGPYVRNYAIAVLRRVSELGEDTRRSVDQGRMITACMTARGILETAGLFVDFIGKLIEMRKKDDKERFRATVKKHFFASREFEDQLTAKSPHVADGVKALDKHVVGSSKIYDILCEAVHPNWAGTAGLNLPETNSGPVQVRSAMAALSTACAVKTYCDIATMAFAGELQPARMIGW